MASTGQRSAGCPQAGCSSTVTYATEFEMRAGSPLWQCQASHHGPRFVGFDGYHD